MISTTGSEPASVSAPGGRVSKMLIDLFMKRATVAVLDDVAELYRLVTLEGPGLRDIAWVPGAQIQFPMAGSVLAVRTYTPIEWNAQAGRLVILAYLHGCGPGSAWLSGLVPGEQCDFYGPRKSIDARALPGELAVFGDETSIGLGCALARQDPRKVVSLYLEIGDVVSAERIIADLGIENVTLFAKLEDEAHLVQMGEVLAPLVNRGTSFVLTGKAGTIQRQRQALRKLGVSSNRIAAKAFWATGKQGLD